MRDRGSATGAGSVTFVGTGFSLITQTTGEAIREIERAQRVLFLVADPAAARWLHSINPTAESSESSASVSEGDKSAASTMLAHAVSSSPLNASSLSGFWTSHIRNSARRSFMSRPLSWLLEEPGLCEEGAKTGLTAHALEARFDGQILDLVLTVRERRFQPPEREVLVA